ncbi:uncharacterized protein LOC113388143 [Ctenocephalides felis]|uniref:uncharacterized protein LOC113388143 n=1 Tax=Ctenocephalides felis TaxID=7515 RepID=UPI000E6E24C9|nr:uncharacterized protein LOC113388143 [Ctenocephalides felis]
MTYKSNKRKFARGNHRRTFLQNEILSQQAKDPGRGIRKVSTQVLRTIHEGLTLIDRAKVCEALPKIEYIRIYSMLYYDRLIPRVITTVARVQHKNASEALSCPGVRRSTKAKGKRRD